jgi:aldose 1-epimerase
LHGVAWQRAWRVVSHDGSSLTLCYRHAPDGHWPFAFEVRQSFALEAGTLRLDLQLFNTDVVVQPAGLGWHPYFPKRERSRLQVAVGTRWESDAMQLPIRAGDQENIDDEICHMAFDHCFSGWTGAAEVRDERFAVRIDSSLHHLVIFTPPAREHFCVEPVSHVNDAIHLADPLVHGLVALEPGQSCAAWMTLAIEPLSGACA